ncbi:uncharacterized protein LOC119349713 [Triticum dicoccoides]|uniref:uncharacterized protein LOC119349713 n=1 Tax=Triticum dicoccoides TaxID=85692 RepID=UPI00188EEA59|nr:uncharacterized protein LOC119349713 [Triticum dicoccoides]
MGYISPPPASPLPSAQPPTLRNPEPEQSQTPEKPVPCHVLSPRPGPGVASRMSAMAATGAALRLRLLFRMLRVGELIALAALLSWSSSRAPSVAAAAMRVAGSLLFSPRFVFVLGNAIVLLLLALSRRERVEPSPASSSAGVGVEQSQAPAASFASFAAPTAPTPTPMPTQASEAAVVALPAMAMATVPEEEEEVVKPVVSVTTRAVSKARAPRRTRSEKMGRRGELSRRSASPEPLPLMRRSESDNGRRRRSSVTARDVAEVGVARGWAGSDDAEEFRRTVEAFIAKQTRFRREEESMAGTLVLVE